MKALQWWDTLTLSQQIAYCFKYPFKSERMSTVDVIKKIYNRHQAVQHFT